MSLPGPIEVKCEFNMLTFKSNIQLFRVSARQIIEASEFKRLSEHTWLLESELELIDHAVKKVEGLMHTPAVETIKRAFELRTNLLTLRFDLSKESRLALKLFVFLITCF